MIAQETAGAHDRACDHTTLVTDLFSCWDPEPHFLFIQELLSALASLPVERGYAWCRAQGKPFNDHSSIHTHGDTRDGREITDGFLV